MSNNSVVIKAYRVTGGAVVSVSRNDRPTRRYKVSLKRFKALGWLLITWPDSFGWQGNRTIDITLSGPVGYKRSLDWILNNGCQAARNAMKGLSA